MTDLQMAIKWLEFMQESGYETEAEQQHCRALLDALRWIPVSDRLPTEETAVELYACGIELAFLRKGKWLRTWDMSVVNPIYVTHWRPLPAPPEGSET